MFLKRRKGEERKIKLQRKGMTYQSMLDVGMQILIRDNGVEKGEADEIPSYVMAEVT